MLELKNVSVGYEQKMILNGISLQLQERETIALIGANGAGKSTLLHTLVGLLLPQQGFVLWNEIEMTAKTLPFFREQIGLIFQNPDDQLFMNTVQDEVEFGLLNQGLSREESRVRATKTLEKLGILHLANRPSHRLSGGEKRSVALAAVLVMEPGLLLFDEPTAFLDPRAVRSFRRLLPEIPGAKLIATHDLAFAKATCSRVLLLQEGCLAADGTTELLKDEALLEACGL